jgi:hypothetical protein
VPPREGVPLVILCYEGILVYSRTEYCMLQTASGDLVDLRICCEPEKRRPSITLVTENMQVVLGPLHTSDLNLYSLHRFIRYDLAQKMASS